MATAELLTIGDEILSGHIVNTNAAWMGRELNAVGIAVRQATSISDDPDRIISALAEALTRVDIVLITGGLGPTKDDVTRKALCEFFGTGLVFNQEVYEDVLRYIKLRGNPENPLHRMQAMVPESCRVIRNLSGTAPGMWFEKEGAVIVSMPGVPVEMKAMMQREVLPGILARFSPGNILYRSALVHGISESNLAIKIAEWEANLPKAVKLASLPHGGYIHLRLSMSGEDESELSRLADAEMEKLKGIAGEFIYDFSDSTPEQLMGRLLTGKSMTLASIECAPGGTLASRLTAEPGGPNWLDASLVADPGHIGKITGMESAFDGIDPASRAFTELAAAGFRDRIGSDLAIAVGKISEMTTETGRIERRIWTAVASAAGIASESFSVLSYHIDKVLFSVIRLLRSL